MTTDDGWKKLQRLSGFVDADGGSEQMDEHLYGPRSIPRPSRPLALVASAVEIREGGWTAPWPKTLGRFPRLKLALGWRLHLTGDEIGEHEWRGPSWWPRGRVYGARPVQRKLDDLAGWAHARRAGYRG